MTAPARPHTPAAAATDGRSSEHHVVVGLGFLSSLKNGDIDACVEMLHPDVEWHPSPRLVVEDVVRGRIQVSHQLESMYERFADLDIVPEEGRQIGEHVLLVALLKGRNRFTGQDAQARVCWVISVREDLWWRIVVYANPPSARLGFEELLGVATVEATHAAHAEPAAPATVAPPEPEPLTITFTLDEAAALSSWLAGAERMGDDAEAWLAFVKLRTGVERAQALGELRGELAGAVHLSDRELAALARTIAAVAGPLV
jgi:ketosteroid isomerase-like protein